MLRKNHALGCILLLGAGLLAAHASGKPEQPAQQKDAKSVKVKVLLPQDASDANIKADDVLIEGEGSERKHTVKLPAGKDQVVLVAVWEPNNYTVITRSRTVKWNDKDGEVLVDFRTPLTKENDRVVVRYVPTPQEFVDAMCKLGKVTKDDVVYDLGCGDARMIITAVKKFGAKRGVGIDIRDKQVQESKDNVKEAGLADKIEIRKGDVLDINDLSDASVVLLYMGDDIDALLKPILKKTLKPGSRVISHRFLMGDDWPPDRSEHVVATKGEYPGYEHDIHLWIIKDQKAVKDVKK